MIKKILLSLFFSIWILGITFSAANGEYEKIITIPAESKEGVIVNLDKGDYLVEFYGGAISLFFPINPRYCWLVGTSVGITTSGGQDYPDIGTIYFEPQHSAFTQAEAEHQALAAVKDKITGTYLRFSLKENKTVRFWVSDFDYSDNSGMIKLKITRQ